MATPSNFETDLPLAELLDVPTFRDVCRVFSELFGIGIKIFDQDDRRVADIRVTTGDHCGYLFSVHPTKVMCTQLVAQIRHCELDAQAGQQPYTIDCFSGLRYKIVPIVHQGHLVGRIIFGPFAPEQLRAPPAALKQYEPDLNLTTLASHLASVTRASDDVVDKIVTWVHQIIDVILQANSKAALASKMHILSMGSAFTELERSNRELKLSHEKVAELDQLKNNFVATVSHELKTPLTSVIGYAQMLMEGLAGDLNDEQRGYVATILEKGEGLLHLITQVLDMSRIESGNGHVARELVDPESIIRRCMSDVAPQAHHRQITLQHAIEPEVLPIAVDAEKIRRVITNLLDNAVKFTADGGTIAVHAALREDLPVDSDRYDLFEPYRNQYLQIDVSDTGMGIAPDKIPRIFDAFYRAHDSRVADIPGTGLGLSIVRNFIHAHKGRIHVQSEPGVGTTFTVLLPYAVDRPGTTLGIDGVG